MTSDSSSNVPPPPAPRRAVLLLGMHRSGTSALARGLAALGVDLGPDLLPQDAHNPRGYWENTALSALNEELLAAQGLAWDSACPLRPSPAAGEALGERARAAIRAQFGDSPLWGFKDPRTARLLWFWRPILASLGIEEEYVLIVRDPAAVVASLRARREIPPIQGLLLWALHCVEALDGTAGCPRVLVDYEGLLEDPEAVIRRVAAALRVPATAAREAAIAAYARDFIDPALRHQLPRVDPGGDAGRDPLARAVRELYAALRAAARGELALDGLDVAEKLGVVRASLAALAPLLARAARPGGAAESAGAADDDAGWRARLEPRLPSALSEGERIHVEVVCTNEGARAWASPQPGEPPLRLSYHLRRSDGEVLAWDNVRTDVDQPVPPDGVVRVQASFVAPAPPGDYLVEWDLVREGRFWFGERGSPTAAVPLRVTAAGEVEAGRYPVERVPVLPWSARFRKPPAEVRVAVAIRTWNIVSHGRREWFDATLASLKEAGHPHELIVVDNGSSDGTSELVAALGGVVLPRAAGQNSSGSGMNAAIERALALRPDLVIFSDDDIAWHPGFLPRLVEFWSHAPHDLALLSGFVEPRWPWNTIRGAIDCGQLRAIVRETASGGAWAFPAENWRWIGPLLDGMEADYRACLRLRRAGFRVAQADLALHLGMGFSTWGNKTPPGHPIDERAFDDAARAGARAG